MLQRAMDSKAVKRLRKSLNLTQEQFAQRLGVARESVARWEVGMVKTRGLSLKALRDLAESTKRKTKRGAK